jgi:hypothetical protein
VDVVLSDRTDPAKKTYRFSWPRCGRPTVSAAGLFAMAWLLRVSAIAGRWQEIAPPDSITEVTSSPFANNSSN